MADTDQKTIIGLSTEMTISGEKVGIDAVIGEDFFLQLRQEASLGTPIGFAYWLKETYAVSGEGIDVLTPEAYASGEAFQVDYLKYKESNDPKFVEKIKAHLTTKKIPAAALDIMTTALLAKVVITDLLIQIKTDSEEKETKKLKFGLAIRFPKALKLLPQIAVDQVTLRILSAPKNDFTFPTPVKALAEPAKTISVDATPVASTKAKGTIRAKKTPEAGNKVVFNGVAFTFTVKGEGASDVKLGSDPAESMAALAKKATAAAKTNSDLKDYTFVSSEGILTITAKTAGKTGNAFTLAAEPEAIFEVQAANLLGGG